MDDDLHPIVDEGTTMDHPTRVAPMSPPPQWPHDPPARTHDPLAVAVANASLLGAGYLLLGRHRLAVGTGLVTVTLLVLLGSVHRSGWFEGLVLLWWGALVVHGWFLAGGHTAPVAVAVRGQRLVALGVTAPVLLAVGLLRFDAAGIEHTVVDARQGGDCAQALSISDNMELGHRVADAPLAVRVDRTVQACERLRTAEERLGTAVDGNTEALRAGFDDLGAVLAELPGHEKMVEVTLDGFLGRIPASDPCHTVAVTDWLRQRQPSDDVLDQSADVVARTAPPALAGCGDDLASADNWEQARGRYQQLLDQYPGDTLTVKAREGVTRTTLAIELANVRSLLTGSTDGQPEYCAKPAKYGGAAPYRRGTNRALIYGNDEYADKLPASWRTTDVSRAVLVVCANDEEHGTRVRTCPYESKMFRQFPQDVTFHKIAIPVKAYELRTGKLVADTKLQISGASCPRILTYTTYGHTDLGPPSEVYVKASNANVRAGFKSLIIR